MKRRQFVFSAATLALINGCGALSNLGKPASPRVVRLGILALDSNSTTNGPFIAGLKQGLAELGYVDGQTIAIELRDPGGSQPERLPELANELIQLPVDVLACINSPTVNRVGSKLERRWRIRRASQLERAQACIPVAVAVAITFALSVWAALVAFGTQVLGHLQLHQRLGHHPHAFTQRVQIGSSVCLA
jgi:hypothetical protein